MKKSDLKDGMIVELRNGDMCIVIGDRLLDLTTYIDLVSYNDNLTCTDTEFDVIRVYENKDMCGLDDKCNIERLNLIWERKEVDWSKVPLGTKVRVWDEETYGEKFEGKFLEYAPEHDEYPFRVYTKEDKDIGLWGNCELIEEPVTYDELKEAFNNYCAGRRCTDCKYETNTYASRDNYMLQNYNVTRK